MIKKTKGRVSRLKNMNDLSDRLDELIYRGFYVESVILISSMLENDLKISIFLQEKYISILLNKDNLLHYSTSDVNKLYKDLENKNLGYLIKKFSIYYKNKKILNNLNKFNNLRNKVAHNMLKNNIFSLNVNLSKEIENHRQFLFNLFDYREKLRLNIKEHGF